MFPDFLCIGAQKSGTTWLHHNLAQHPLVWLPPTKEIHYFDWPPTSLFERLFGRKGRMREARAHLIRTMTKALSGQAKPGELGWAVRFCLAPRSDGWYQSLFRRPQGMIAGEITPSYCLLPPEKIRRLHRLMPEAKIVYLIRHPVERAWSAAVMHFNDKGRGGIEHAPPDQVIAWLTRPRTSERCDYSRTASNWQAAYGDQFLVGFYDELRTDPRRLLTRIQTFLGLPVDIPADVAARRNPGNWTMIPQPFRGLLQEMYLEPMAELQAILKHPYTEDWLQRYASSQLPPRMVGNRLKL